jgi:hypothetical protein
MDVVEETWSSVPRMSLRLRVRGKERIRICKESEKREMKEGGWMKARRGGKETHDRAFMTRCSTSSTGTRASEAITLKGRTRSEVGRRKTASMRAIRQIF